jgi:prevent-host-death family protein
MSVVNTVNINTVNIHEAKTHLSRLVEQAAKGREFVIAKAGKPMVRVVPVQAPSALRSLGYLAGKGTITADVKAAFAEDIDRMFSPGP